MTRWVYFMRPVGLCGPVKIGCSVEPSSRLDHYSRISPFKLELFAVVPGDFRVEYGLHAMFADDHSHHEWFQYSDRMQGVIDALVAGTFDLSTLPARNCPWASLPRRKAA